MPIRSKLWSAGGVLVVALVNVGQAPRPTVIPETAEWEVTFHQVEQALGLPEMRTLETNAFEARIMQRAWADPAVWGTPFLRIVRTAGVVEAKRYAFGNRAQLQRRGIPDIDMTCQERLCVGEVALEHRSDWESSVVRLAATDACPRDGVVVCGDCLQIWIKTFVNGAYLEQSCQQPAEGTLVSHFVALMELRPF